MTINECFKIGLIMKPHGLKGEVTVSLDADCPDDLESLESVFVDRNNRLIPFFLEAISVRGDKAFVKFDEVDTPEEANKISKSAIYLPKALRAKSGRGEFYDDEITGFEVIDDTLGPIGKVTEVIQAGPNRLVSVDKDGKEILIPVNSPFIISINKSKRKISVTLPEGFLDI